MLDIKKNQLLDSSSDNQDMVLNDTKWNISIEDLSEQDLTPFSEKKNVVFWRCSSSCSSTTC